jgi:electron transfer flavoprotein beta subunit
VRIVVLAKPVPDTTGSERLGPDHRLDRASAPTIVNPNDEHAVEQAIRLIEAHGGEITLLTMAPPNATATMRKALAMGATRGVLVTDPALEGSCALATAKVLAAALATLEFDLVLAGIDTSDGGSGIVAAAIATLRGLPYLSYASSVGVVDGRVRVERLGRRGHDVIDAPLPALVAVTQMVGEPRYASLKGIMGARSKEIATVGLDELGLLGAALGGDAATTRVLRARAPAARGATRVVRASAAEAAHEIVEFLADRRLI